MEFKEFGPIEQAMESPITGQCKSSTNMFLAIGFGAIIIAGGWFAYSYFKKKRNEQAN